MTMILEEDRSTFPDFVLGGTMEHNAELQSLCINSIRVLNTHCLRFSPNNS